MITIKNLHKSFLNSTINNLFEGFNFQINDGDFIAIFGSNGIGKTTLLRIVAGLEKFQSGEIQINGKILHKAKIGYIPQDCSKSLLPWYTVKENIILPLSLAGKNAREIQIIFEEMKDKFSIQLPWGDYPYNLSGGQQQMVVIYRSIINDPDILLMDEPFSFLDLQTSLEMQEKLLEICQKKKLTTLFVSHRIEEGLYLSNRILILKGRPATIMKDIKNDIPLPRKHTIEHPILFNKLLDEISNSIIS